MTERDDRSSDGFLVDGVAPSVIGGDSSPEPAGDNLAFERGTRREPPTTPIPAQGEPEQRKGWLGRMFGRD